MSDYTNPEYTIESHNTYVSRISSRVAHFHSTLTPFHLYHGSTNSTRPSKRSPSQVIDILFLSHVLSINASKSIVIVEPNVSMAELVAATLPHGLVPPVVMEFPGITVGGGFAGTGCESSSFRHGFFDRTVIAIEIVLGNGEIARASRTEREDLFYAASAGFGTVGVVTLLEVELVPAKKWVELEYVEVQGVEGVLRRIKEMQNDLESEFCEGIMFGRERAVICSGRQVDVAPSGQVQRISRARDPWFYLHADEQGKSGTKSGSPRKDYIPLTDYLFRYDRGAFWTGRTAYKYFLVPFTWLTRLLLDYFMHTSIMYHALHESGYARTWILQDLVIPYPRVEEFIQYIHEKFGCYPLWLCPINARGKDANARWGTLANKPKDGADDVLLNVGVYTGIGVKDYDQFVRINRDLERKVSDLGGEKWFYAQTFYAEEEFWKLLNKQEYDTVRSKYHAEYLPTIYDKVRIDIKKESARASASNEGWKAWVLSFWHLAALYGILKALLRSDYTIARNERPSKQLQGPRATR